MPIKRNKNGTFARTARKQTKDGKAVDRLIKDSKKPGKRKSASGKVYYEYRTNRSDRNPKKGL